MAAEGKIAAEDLDRVFVTDDPAEAAAHIVERCLPDGAEGAGR
jgi:hypothetical protein